MIRACLVSSALLVSCADDSIRWELPQDVTDEERADFGEAAERWNHVAIRQQYIAEPGDGTRRVELRLPEHMVAGPYASGEWIAGARVMHLRRGMDRRTFVMVAAHEMGHGLGLKHIAGPGLMAESAGQIEFSDGDIAECHRVNACR
jgi:hypothetical protein